MRGRRRFRLTQRIHGESRVVHRRIRSRTSPVWHRTRLIAVITSCAQRGTMRADPETMRADHETMRAQRGTRRAQRGTRREERGTTREERGAKCGERITKRGERRATCGARQTTPVDIVTSAAEPHTRPVERVPCRARGAPHPVAVLPREIARRNGPALRVTAPAQMAPSRIASGTSCILRTSEVTSVQTRRVRNVTRGGGQKTAMTNATSRL